MLNRKQLEELCLTCAWWGDKEVLMTAKADDFHDINREAFEIMIKYPEIIREPFLLPSKFKDEIEGKYIANQFHAEIPKQIGNLKKGMLYLQEIREIDCSAKIVCLLHGKNKLTRDDLDALKEIGKEQISIGTKPIAMMEAVEDYLNTFEEKKQLYKDGLPYPTGFDILDKAMTGLSKKHLILIGGRTSTGKTNFLLQIADNLAEKGIKVLFVSLEMSEEDLRIRWISRRCQIDNTSVRIRNFNADNKKELTDLYMKMGIEDNKKLTIVFKPELSIDGFSKLVNDSDSEFVFLDYVQQMAIPNGESRAQALAETVRKFKVIAGENNCGIVVASQINREAEYKKGNAPELNNLKDSGGLEENSDTVILLHRIDKPDIVRMNVSVEVRAMLKKNRQGGLVTSIMDFEGQYCTFRERGVYD